MPQELRARNKVLGEAEDRFRLLNRRYFKRIFTLREVFWILRDLKQPPPRRIHFDVTVIQEELIDEQ